VKSHTATRLRQWATRQLREYIVKGFVMDDERLKNPDQPFDCRLVFTLSVGTHNVGAY